MTASKPPGMPRDQVEGFLDRDSRDRNTRAMNELVREMRRGGRRLKFGPTLGERPQPAEQPQQSDRHNPAKVAAAQRALDAVRTSGRTPSNKNVALKSERLGAKLSRATVAAYRKAGLLDF